MRTSKLEEAWGEASDLLARQARDRDILYGNDSPEWEGRSTKTAQAEVIEVAREIRQQLDRAHTGQARIDAERARLDAVDPYEIDERVVGYIRDYQRNGATYYPGADDRPVVDTALEMRLVVAGIDLGTGSDESTDMSGNVR